MMNISFYNNVKNAKSTRLEIASVVLRGLAALFVIDRKTDEQIFDHRRIRTIFIAFEFLQYYSEFKAPFLEDVVNFFEAILEHHSNNMKSDIKATYNLPGLKTPFFLSIDHPKNDLQAKSQSLFNRFFISEQTH
jgi:hypothetical protein